MRVDTCSEAMSAILIYRAIQISLATVDASAHAIDDAPR
jgi:hypothetical protein